MCSLSILFAYKVGLFNIGAAGQYCIGVALSLYAALGWGWGWLPCMLLAMVGGALLARFQSSVQANTFTSTMTYEILLIVVIGGIGSVSGSIIASFLFIASSEWLLRFLDNETWIGGFRVPLLRSGFRMVVFSIVIMVVVLFFRKGIMGDRELFQKKPAKAAKKEVRSK